MNYHAPSIILCQGKRVSMCYSLETDRMEACSCGCLDQVDCVQLVVKGSMSMISFDVDPLSCLLHL